jgi:hypothetical protein
MEWILILTLLPGSVVYVPGFVSHEECATAGVIWASTVNQQIQTLAQQGGARRKLLEGPTSSVVAICVKRSGVQETP